MLLHVTSAACEALQKRTVRRAYAHDVYATPQAFAGEWNAQVLDLFRRLESEFLRFCSQQPSLRFLVRQVALT